MAKPYTLKYILIFAPLLSAALLFIIPWIMSVDTWASHNPEAIVQCGTHKDSTGKVTDPCSVCDIFVLIENIVNFIWTTIVPGLAIIFLLYGGILMVVPGFSGEKSAASYQKGKKILTNTVVGIVIVFVAWLVIDYAIKLVGGKIASDSGFSSEGFGPWNQIKCVAAAPPPTPPTPPPPPPPTPPPGGTLSEREARSRLTAAGIIIEKNPCPPNTPFQNVPGGCTSLEGIPASTVDRLIRAKQDCDRLAQPQNQGSCVMVITGVTELGHQTHGPGRPIVDLRLDNSQGTQNTAQFIRDNASSLGVVRICTAPQDARYRLSCNTGEPQRHLHVEFAL